MINAVFLFAWGRGVAVEAPSVYTTHMLSPLKHLELLLGFKRGLHTIYAAKMQVNIYFFHRCLSEKCGCVHCLTSQNKLNNMLIYESMTDTYINKIIIFLRRYDAHYGVHVSRRTSCDLFTALPRNMFNPGRNLTEGSFCITQFFFKHK